MHTIYHTKGGIGTNPIFDKNTKKENSMSDSGNTFAMLIGAIVIVAIGGFAVKQLAGSQSQQTRRGTPLTTKEQDREMYQRIIAEAVRDRDKERLTGLLDSSCVDFPDLIAKIKDELRKMG